MKITILIFWLVTFTSVLFAQKSLIKNDNGTPRTNYEERQDWEETVFLIPDGPCDVVELQIYYAGDTPGKDTVFCPEIT